MNRAQVVVLTLGGSGQIALAVSVLCGAVIPAAVALLSKQHAPAWLKATLNLGLSAVAGVLTEVSWDGHVRWTSLVLSIGATWAVSVATHFGWWKPTTLTARLATRTARFGLPPQRRRGGGGDPGGTPATPPPVSPPGGTTASGTTTSVGTVQMNEGVHAFGFGAEAVPAGPSFGTGFGAARG